jgi:DNA-binding response OmpR family regulator
VPETTSAERRRPRLVFCTSRPSRYTAILAALRVAFVITVVDNGPAAAEAVETGPEILIIEDQLVGGDGLELAQAARRMRWATRMTIIMNRHSPSGVPTDVKIA